MTEPYTVRRWTPWIEEPPPGRFDDETLYNVQDNRQRHAPKLVWFGDAPPEPPPMLIQDILPQDQVAIAAGVYSSGKTFAVVDVATCIMKNVPFAGHQIVRPGGVLWFAAEGANEIDARIRAAAEAKSVDDDEPSALPFARQAFDVPRLTAPEAEAEIIAHADAFKAGLRERFPGTELVVVVIDTLGSAAGFVDGNSSAEAQRVMDMLRRVNVATGALVLIVDHFGKAVETGVMGASAKAQSADAVLAILADKSIEGEISNRRLAVAKLRGGASGAVIPFKLRQVPVGHFGGTTCVVEWGEQAADISSPKQEKKPAWSGKARIFKSAVETSLIEHGETYRPYGEAGPIVKATPLERVRTEFRSRYPAENSEAKQTAFKRFLSAASERGLIESKERGGVDWIWFVRTEDETSTAITAQMNKQVTTADKPNTP